MKTVTLPEAVIFGVVGGITMKIIGLLYLLAATVCVACAFINKE